MRTWQQGDLVLAGKESQECCVFVYEVGIRGIYLSLTLCAAKFSCSFTNHQAGSFNSYLLPPLSLIVWLYHFRQGREVSYLLPPLSLIVWLYHFRQGREVSSSQGDRDNDFVSPGKISKRSVNIMLAWNLSKCFLLVYNFILHIQIFSPRN